MGRIRAPAARYAPAQADRHTAAVCEAHPAPITRHILVVEDDPRTAAVIREALVLDGEPEWTIEIAGDGLRALDLAHHTPPHLVLLDLALPGIDGAEVYRRLRTSPRTQQARVLFLTAATSLDLYQRGVETGAILRKPFDLRELTNLVRALLSSEQPGSRAPSTAC